jgi:6-pyruvoyltetrahydropterin/6-carboxytetrahydropterin synthase
LPSYLLRVRARFEAAHHLTSYRGAPEPVHGHSWQVEAALAAAELDAEGMGFDFVAVKEALAGLVARFDHRDLNSVPPFDRESPTTERLAAWFYGELARRLPEASLAEVTVWEGADASATYRP